MRTVVAGLCCPMFVLCADCDGLITQALLTANFESAVDVCIEHGRWAEAIILAIAGGPQLLMETEKRFFETNKSSVNQVRYSFLTQLTSLQVFSGSLNELIG